METKSSQKVANNFECKICDYLTSKKSNFAKHLLTAKHLSQSARKQMETFGNQKVAKSSQYECEICKKSYSNRSGLWKHQSKCISKNGIIITDSQNITTLSNLVMEVVKQNQTLADKILDICKTNIITTNNIQL